NAGASARQARSVTGQPPATSHQQLPATSSQPPATRIDDVALASRLSFFLWDTGPDEELMKLATRGRLSSAATPGTPGALDKQVKRLLADPQADALSTRFAAQWLRLHDVDGMLPDAIL